MDRMIQWPDRYASQALAAILLLGLLVRMVALLNLSNSVYHNFLLWDERLYHTWVTAIANGTFRSSAAYEMAPFPAYLNAFVYWLFSPDIFYIRVMNIVFGVSSRASSFTSSGRNW